ncbi:hypothetical protein LIER_40542 [Lithospermum erythrorhizon]|uniref:Reverse transcriptase n=1 Tax=Lithospermum erythrorhizon TaxID=34254 RepID=A0AAV3QZI7_LITER
MFPNWSYIHNIIPGDVGRIWIVWKPHSVTITELSKSDQHIMCEVKGSVHEHKDFCLSVIYGRNDKELRNSLWMQLKNDKLIVGDLPWIVGGDFNAVRYVEEALGGNLPIKQL